jgi:hypothetical protein
MHEIVEVLENNELSTTRIADFRHKPSATRTADFRHTKTITFQSFFTNYN